MKLLFTAFLLLAAAHAQEGVIAGTVRDAGSHALLPGATVSLSAGAYQTSTVTDGKGAFHFERLALETYSLRCSLAGYLGSELQGAFHRLDLKSKAVREGLTIDLIAITTVEGMVFDEDGAPMGGVGIYTGNSLQATTERDGRFRIENLAPASYRVDLRIPLEIRKRTLKRDPETGETFGYANTHYYPGTADAQAAVRIPISGGLYLRGFDIRLRRVRLVDVIGRVMERAGGEPLPGARVELAANFATLSDETFAVRPVDRAGGFRFDLIQPGSYALLVFRSDSPTAMPYVHAVETGKTGIADLVVPVPPFQKVEGAIAMTPEGAEWTGRVAINLMPMQRGSPPRTFNITGAQFTLDNVPPGRYSLIVQSSAELKAGARKLVVNGVRLGTQDVMAGAAVITESGNPPVEIRLSAETGRLIVKFFGPDDSPQQRLVFINRKPGEGGGLVRMAYLTAPGGTFTMNDLAPGTYEVALATDGAIPSAANPPTSVEVKAGATAVVQLRDPAR